MVGFGFFGPVLASFRVNIDIQLPEQKGVESSMAQTISDGKVVQLSYSLTNTKGELLDRADRNEPFTYLHGASQIVPGLEGALLGLKTGDTKKVKVAAADGYGEIDADLQLKVKRSQFPADVEIKPGMQFETRGPDGSGMIFTINGVTGDQVEIDGNHPLAGEELHFDVEVLEIRDATEEEKSHGHAHGPEGHGHDHGDHEHGEDCDHDDDNGHSGHTH
jgi:FKBP-type peptidyl-prolyl cis-trans isomerase SlyD